MAVVLGRDDGAGDAGNLFAPGGVPDPSPDMAALALERLDELSRLLRDRAAAHDAAPDDRLARAEAAWSAALAAAEERARVGLAMQGEIIEALLADRDAADAAMARLDVRAAAAEDAARALAVRVAALESDTGDDAREALAEASERLGEVILRLDALSLRRLGAGRPLQDLVEELAARVAALDGRLTGWAGEDAPPVAPPATPPDAPEPDAPEPDAPEPDAPDAIRAALAGLMPDDGAPSEGRDA